MARYTFEAAELTCVALEQELGLKRGDVKEIVIYPEGAVEVEAIDLTAAQQDKLKEVLGKRSLPRGRRH